MRTVDEIIERVRTKLQELLSFEPEVLLPFLTFEEAKPILKPDATSDGWEATPRTREAVLSQAETYMREYGWPKALGHRGISAGRTVEKMTAWCWLIGDDEAVAFCEAEANYPSYGAPVLAFLCERFGWPIPDSKAAQNMVAGKDCTGHGYCREGCM